MSDEINIPKPSILPEEDLRSKQIADLLEKLIADRNMVDSKRALINDVVSEIKDKLPSLIASMPSISQPSNNALHSQPLQSQPQAGNIIIQSGFWGTIIGGIFNNMSIRLFIEILLVGGLLYFGGQKGYEYYTIKNGLEVNQEDNVGINKIEIKKAKDWMDCFKQASQQYCGEVYNYCDGYSYDIKLDKTGKTK